LVADKFFGTELLHDIHLYKVIRQLFRINETACCSTQEPENENVVYHHRNFWAEFQKEQLVKLNPNTPSSLFTEVTPYVASKFMFSQHTIHAKDANSTYPTMNSITNHKRVSILSRSLDGLDAYQYAFNVTNHLPSYIVQHPKSESNVESGMNDFCFITKSRNEVIGKLHSTFVQWASLLGNSAITRLYTINDTPIAQIRDGNRTKDNGKNHTPSLEPCTPRCVNIR
jgi:hypothetical protein